MTSDEFTALASAVYRSESMVKLLLEHNADPTVTFYTPYKNNCVKVALQRRNENILKLLYSELTDQWDMTAIDPYSQLDNEEDRDDIDFLNRSLVESWILRAARKNDLNSLKYDLNNPDYTAYYDLNCTDDNENTALNLACKYLHVKIVKYLLSKNVDVNYTNNKGHSPLVTTIRAKPNYLTEDECNKAKIEIINILMGQVLNLNTVDKNGDTPVHHAIYENNIDILNMLLIAQPNLEIPNKEGKSPFLLACYEQNLDIAKLLLKNGANPKTFQDKTENSALHLLATNNSTDSMNTVEMAKWLLAIEIPLDCKSSQQQSALELAFNSNQSELCLLLMASYLLFYIASQPSIYPQVLNDLDFLFELIGKNIAMRDVEGRSLLHIAVSAGHDEFLSYLYEKYQAANIDLDKLSETLVDNNGNTPEMVKPGQYYCKYEDDVIKIINKPDALISNIINSNLDLKKIFGLVKNILNNSSLSDNNSNLPCISSSSQGFYSRSTGNKNMSDTKRSHNDAEHQSSYSKRQKK